jgi:hypothetical protein
VVRGPTARSARPSRPVKQPIEVRAQPLVARRADNERCARGSGLGSLKRGLIGHQKLSPRCSSWLQEAHILQAVPWPGRRKGVVGCGCWLLVVGLFYFLVVD